MQSKCQGRQAGARFKIKIIKYISLLHHSFRACSIYWKITSNSNWNPFTTDLLRYFTSSFPARLTHFFAIFFSLQKSTNLYFIIFELYFRVCSTCLFRFHLLFNIKGSYTHSQTNKHKNILKQIHISHWNSMKHFMFVISTMVVNL